SVFRVVLRQREGEGGAAAGGLDVHRTTVLAYDLLHDREPEAGTALFAGGDERLENAALDLLGDAGTGVGNLHHQVARGARTPDSQGDHPSLVADGLDGVSHQIEYGSFYLALI